jgi:alpha-ketoglutarate-dependent taurine dioxygenase
MNSTGSSNKSFNPVRRRAIPASMERMINISFLDPERKLPALIEPKSPGVQLAACAPFHREAIDDHLLKFGAILFRGFEVGPVDEFERVIHSLAGEPMEYRDRATPRNPVGDRIYTSTEYPADQTIELHNECSYAQTWPSRILFYCVEPAVEGGETPIADCRKVLQSIDSEIQRRFEAVGVMYVRHFGFGFGPSWREAFNVEERGALESYCKQNSIAYEWEDQDRLKVWQVRPAIARRPESGEAVWFNQATAFHHSTLAPALREVLAAELGEDRFPKHVYYGDGEKIPDSVLANIREAYRRETVSFTWQRGDVLLLDNMLTAHGRARFIGPRRILVGMAGAMTWDDAATSDVRSFLPA